MPSNAPQTPSTASTVAGEVPVPEGLDARGAALWGRVVGQWDLRDDERELLTEVCRIVDTVEALQGAVDADGAVLSGGKVHPAVPELRQQRTVLGRLLGQLALPDEDGSVLASPTAARARKAAETRWAMHRARGA